MATSCIISYVKWIPKGLLAEQPNFYSKSLVEDDNSSVEDLKPEKKLINNKKKQNKWSSKNSSKVEESASNSEDSSGEADEQEEIFSDWEDEEEEEGEGLFTALKNDGEGAAHFDASMYEEDSEDFEASRILPTDLPLVVTSIEEDAACLELFIYDTEGGSFYVHHDNLVGANPLCMEYMWRQNEGENNLLFLGSMQPEIEIWDLDCMTSIEPLWALGQKNASPPAGNSNDSKKGKKAEAKKRKKVLCAEASPAVETSQHTAPVLSLNLHSFSSNMLLSASQDATVKIWDVSQDKCMYTYTHHNDAVQSACWHTKEPNVVLSASFDKTAVVFDARDPQSYVSASLGSSAESSLWDRHNPMNFLVSCEDGSILNFDMRKLSNAKDETNERKKMKKKQKAIAPSLKGQKDKPVWSIKPQNKATTGIADSAVPNLLVSSSLDGFARIWDISKLEDGAPTLIQKKDLKVGQLYCCQGCPDASPNPLFAFGGTSVALWHVDDSKLIRTNFNLKRKKQLQAVKA